LSEALSWSEDVLLGIGKATGVVDGGVMEGDVKSEVDDKVDVGIERLVGVGVDVVDEVVVDGLIAEDTDCIESVIF
jgi:hypothetical protein